MKSKLESTNVNRKQRLRYLFIIIFITLLTPSRYSEPRTFRQLFVLNMNMSTTKPKTFITLQKPSTSTCSSSKSTSHPKANLSTGSINSKGEAVPRLRKTEVKPFSFESRDKERYNKKEDKIKGIIQKEEKVSTLFNLFDTYFDFYNLNPLFFVINRKFEFLRYERQTSS